MLVATIWFVALLALVAVIVGGWLERSLGRASALQDRLAAHAETIGAVDEIAYMMLTGYYSPRGLELGDADALANQPMPDTLGFALRAGTPFVALDDRPYRLGDLVLRLQDDHGLLPLNVPDRSMLGGLLRGYGVPYDYRDVLIDRLLDYADKSQLIRLNGADAGAYLRAGKPPPRNGPLLTPWEADRVLGWDEYPKLWSGDEPFPAQVTVRDLAGLNPNTAPAAVLRAVPGFDPRAVARLLAYRANWVMTSVDDLQRATGVIAAVDPMAFYFFPANSLRLTILVKNDPLARSMTIRLRPIAQMPYRIDYRVERPSTSADRALFDRRDLPDLALPQDFPAIAEKPALAGLVSDLGSPAAIRR